MEYLSTASYKGYGHAMSPQELNVPIGSALGDMYQQRNAYWRDFTNCEVIVNPSMHAVDITLSARTMYIDVAGKRISSTLHLPPTSARILLKSKGS